jgi:hypothetical protein
MNTNENRNHRNETKNQSAAPVECWKSVPGIEGVERWWAGLRPVERQVARVIAGMMQEVTATKRIEIRREGTEIRRADFEDTGMPMAMPDAMPTHVRNGVRRDESA